MIKEIKSIPLATFLSQLGHKPTMRKGTRLWYRSPLRLERTPSFKVETTLNCYLDNDNAGRTAMAELTKRLDSTVIDRSTLYAEFNDLNEYLINIQNNISNENK